MEKKNETYRDDSPTAKQNVESEPGANAVMENPQSVAHHLGPEKKTKNYWEELKARAPVVGLFVAAFAAVASAFSACVAWAVLDANIKRDRLDQRAWVGVVQQDRLTEIIADVPYTWRFRVRNSGKTPALNVRRITDFGEGLKDQKFVPVYRRGEPGEPENKSATVFQPGEGKFLQAGPVTFPQRAIEAIKGGNALFYLHGQIQYDDVFGATHCTLFCEVLGRELPHLTSCAEYNEVTDIKCPNIE